MMVALYIIAGFLAYIIIGNIVRYIVIKNAMKEVQETFEKMAKKAK